MTLKQRAIHGGRVGKKRAHVTPPITLSMLVTVIVCFVFTE